VSRRLAVLALTLGLALAGPASAEIYRWVDGEGVPHFSDRAEEVPPAFRDQLGALGEPGEDAEETSPAGLGALRRALSGEADAEPPAAAGDEAIGPFEARRLLERMRGPMAAVALVTSLVVMGFVLAFLTLALLVACRLLGQESPGFRRAYGIVVVQFVAGVLAAPGVVMVAGEPQQASLAALLRLQALHLGVSLALNTLVLRAMLCDSVGRALALAVVMNLVLVALGVLAGVLVVTCAGGAALVGAG
jgi:hypothetical protein